MRATIERYRMLERTKSVLVACSGGPDSMALLYALNELKNEYRITLAGFHLNHQLREGESKADEAFVRQVFKKLDIPLTVKTAAVARYAKDHKLSLEEGAREVRYRLLGSTAQAIKADRIALGHTLNDNAETVLLNLIQGSGHSGLCGIPPVRGAIVRPLIEIERDEIMGFLDANKIPYRLDTTNADLRFLRNFIRHRIIPLFLKRNPGFFKTMSKTTAILRQDEECLTRLATQALAKVAKREKDGFYLDIPTFLAYNDSIKRRVIKQLKPTLDFELIEKVLDVVGGPSGKVVSLPRDWIAVKEYDRLYLGKNRAGIPVTETRVVLGRTTDYAGWRIKTKLKNKCELNRKPNGCEIFDFNQVKLPLTIRTRKPGDRFQPLGLGAKKKLKEVLINDKIPKRLRDNLPLLCDQDGILWVVGGRRSERAKITNKTKNFLLVEALMKPEKRNDKK